MNQAQKISNQKDSIRWPLMWQANILPLNHKVTDWILELIIIHAPIIL